MVNPVVGRRYVKHSQLCQDVGPLVWRAAVRQGNSPSPTPCGTACGWHVVNAGTPAMNTVRSDKAKRPPQTTFAGIHWSNSLLELDVWMPSEIGAISPTVEPLIRVIETWRCSEGNEFAVELGLREALNNAVIHGNGTDPNKLVEVRCRIERGKGVWLIVKDQGKGFDPNAVPDPLAAENLQAEYGRGIRLMKLMMDEVSFQHGGTEVHMRKGSTRKLRPAPPRENERVFSGAAEGLDCEAIPVGRE